MKKYFHGDDIYNFSNIKYNFSSNIWPYFNFENLYSFLSDNLDKIKNYPDPENQELIESLSKYHNIEKKKFLIGNGTVEIFNAIAFAFYGSKSLILAPTFVEYEKVTLAAKHNVKNISNHDELKYNGFDLVWICNPNNPTGKIIERDIIVDIIKNYPKKIFVVDEAYIDYTDKAKSLIEFVDIFDNLIVTRSFTKKYAIPGLRIGYIVANDKIISKLKDILPTWNVNVMAQLAANFLLNNDSLYKIPLNEIYSLKQDLVNELNNVDYLTIIQSDMHYFLMKINKYKSYELKDKLAKEFGILVRDASNFYGLDDSYIRISSLKKDANQYLVNSLKQI